MATVPTTPGAAGAQRYSIRGDKAIRFVPYTPSKEEDEALLRLIVEGMPLPQRLEKALVLLGQADTSPEAPFLPMPWTAAEAPALATLDVEDMEEDHDDDQTEDAEDDN